MPTFKLSQSDMNVIEQSFNVNKPVISKSLLNLYENKDNLTEEDRGFVSRLIRRHSAFERTTQSQRYINNMDYFYPVINDYILYAYMLASCTDANFSIAPTSDTTPFLLLTKYYGELPLEFIDKILDNSQKTISGRFDTYNSNNERYSLIDPLIVGAYMNKQNTQYILDNISNSQLFYVNKMVNGNFKYALGGKGSPFSLFKLNKIMNALNINTDCVISQYELYDYVIECIQDGSIAPKYFDQLERSYNGKKNLDIQYFTSLIKLLK